MHASRTRLLAVGLLALALSIALPAHPALAAWPHNSLTNLAVCTAPSNQFSPVFAPDGAGGEMIAWYDTRGSSSDIYAQHVLASGVVDPVWPVNGRALCTATGDQVAPAIVSDGLGGAIVTWMDLRTGVYDIYAQHVQANGTVDPAWPVNGQVICNVTGAQQSPNIVSDGANGAIIEWADFRNAANWDVYAHHVLANGTLDPSWTATGVAVCTAVGDQLTHAMVSDGAGGALICWTDNRGGSTADIYAQHVLANGTIDPAGTLNGNIICSAAGDQLSVKMVSDGLGGAIAAWSDARSGATYDIYAEHVLANGNADPGWQSNGTPVCTAANNQVTPVLASDGAGGAIIAWNDFRSGSDVYAEHVIASGILDPAWPATGLAVCTAAGAQSGIAIASDGAGGAFIAWQDLRTGLTYDIFGGHVLASGTVDPIYPVNGLQISGAANDQLAPAILADGAGGAIIAWYDGRSASFNYDIYAQRIGRFGYLGTPEPEIIEVKDVPNDNGGRIKLAWNASYLDLASDPNLAAYDIYRSVPPNLLAERVSHGARIAGGFARVPVAGSPVLIRERAETYAWEYVATVAPAHFANAYSYLAPTAEDSTSYGNPKSSYLVLARNSSGSMYWPSRSDSGYSVDNLPPLPPQPFTGQYGAGIAHLHWSPNSEADLANYRLYRGTSATFVPGPGNFVAAPSDTGFADNAGQTYYYKLSAVDIHGNESGFSTLLPIGTLSAPGDALPHDFALERPAPDPASSAATLRFALPLDAAASLLVLDVTGRHVRTLWSGVTSAGEHAVSWDLRDDNGRAVGAGLYFVRFTAGDRTLTRRLVAIR